MSQVAPTPTKDLSAEAELIGSLLARPDLILEVQDVARPDDFTHAGLATMYAGLLSLYNDDAHVDTAELIRHLQEQGKLEAAGGASAIFKAGDAAIAPGKAPGLARRLRSCSTRRQIIQAARETISEAEQVPDEHAFLQQTEHRFLSLTAAQVKSELIPLSSVRMEYADHLQRMMAQDGTLTGQPCGITELDRLTRGLQGGQLIVVAARPGLGKTTLAMNIASAVAQGSPEDLVLFYSLEMSRIELYQRLLCAESLVPTKYMTRSYINDTPMLGELLLHSMVRVGLENLHVDDSGDLTIWECMARTRRASMSARKQNKRVRLVIVDYLQLMSDPESRKIAGRQHEVATMSRKLKQLAKAIDAPVIALSQLNRQVEKSRSKNIKPQLSDLRESGAIEQDADIVSFLHRPERDHDSPPGDLVQLCIEKHRGGPTGEVDLAYRADLFRFDNVINYPANGRHP